MTETASPRGDVLARLERRVATDGSRPLVTWYDLDQGYRTELSGRTFANWVDKSANLLVSMDVEEFPRVANTLLVTHPGHWVGLVWTLATWQLGGSVVATTRAAITSTDLLDAAIVGPSDPHPVPGVETIACSLHPLGAGFTDRPSGVTDYSEVLSQPDVHWRVPASRAVCFEGDQRKGWQDLAVVTPVEDRVAVVPAHNAWRTLGAAIVGPLLGGGSSVVVTGGAPAEVARVAGQERARLPEPANGSE